MYPESSLGNSTLIILTLLDSHFTSLYFFLGNLSFLDILYILLYPLNNNTFYQGKKSPSLGVLFWYVSFTMASHRVCDPSSDGTWLLHSHLHAFEEYPIIMSKALCIQMAALSWRWGFLNSLVQFLQYTYPSVGKMSSIILFMSIGLSQAGLHRYFLEWDYSLMFGSVLFLFVSLLLRKIFISYIFILSIVLEDNSSGGRKKAFPPAQPTLQWWLYCFMCQSS